jgi:hypothetical protein
MIIVVVGELIQESMIIKFLGGWRGKAGQTSRWTKMWIFN